ncbi:metal ABC transporter ATP-binding protein [Candidatus Saccharibacteria bacterium]|nr:metal ABC transporter ATP-binding protein [Candidatus Saccharibacteria bacterium]
MSLVEIKNLSLGYGKNKVIRDLDLKIEEGDFVCIVGPNGAGKSTLVKGILGLLRPLHGTIKFNEMKRNFIGFLPQETKVDPNFPATVLEIVLSGTLNTLGRKIFYSKKEREVAHEKMKLVGIEKLSEKSFSELSGGQRQKVLLARALAATRKLLILDEPMNNLDQKSILELRKTLQKINREGITILMITHDLDHGNLLGNKILSLRDEIFYGPTEEFIRRIHNE